jgi:hypothetical protein
MAQSNYVTDFFKRFLLSYGSLQTINQSVYNCPYTNLKFRLSSYHEPVICAIVEATVGAVKIMLHNGKNTAGGGCDVTDCNLVYSQGMATLSQQ